MEEPKCNLSRNCRSKYNNKRIIITKVHQHFDGPELLDTNSSEAKYFLPKRNVFTSNYSHCEVSNKSVKNIYWRCAAKDGKKNKKRNKLTKVKKPRILKQQIIKCHVSSHRGTRECVRDIDNFGKNLTSVHSIESIQSLTYYEKKIEHRRPFWFKKISYRTKTTKNQHSQAHETDIEEQCELVLEDHNAEADDITISVFEISTEKQLNHVIYDVESATSYHSSITKKQSAQTCVVQDTDEPCNFILSGNIELTFSDFQTMNENQLNDIICQIQNAMLSCETIKRNSVRSSFEIIKKQCYNDGLTFGNIQKEKEIKDISELEASSSDCDTSNSAASEVEATPKIESINTSRISDGIQETVSSSTRCLPIVLI